MSTAADVAILGPLIIAVDPETYELMVVCLDHGPDCKCWASETRTDNHA